MSISNINSAPFNTIQYINGVPILSIGYINGVQTTLAPPLQYLLIGGQFTQYNAPSTSRIAKIDQNGNLILDSSFNTGTGVGSTTYDIKQQPDGKYVIAGIFSSYSGSSASRVARINQNGTFDNTFAANGTLNNTALSVLPFPNNSVLVGGAFTTYATSSTTLTVNRVIKFNSSGAVDPTFNTGFGFNSNVTSFATQSDGKIIAVGLFSQYSSSNNFITATDLSGSRISGPGTGFNTGVGFNGSVFTYATQSDGKILIGGQFTTYSGSGANATRIIRINSNGTQDTSFVTGTGFNTDVYTIKVQTDGKIIVGGLFTTYNGSTVNYITRLNSNGTRDTTFNTGTGASSTVRQSHIQSDGKIVIVGNFASYSGSSNPGIVRINTDGTKDTSFNVGAGTVGAVYSLNPTGSQYIIGGNFTSYSGSTQNYITRINADGTRDTTFNIGTGFNSLIYSTAVDSSGKVIAAGNFFNYSGSSVSYIVRINTNGTRDTSFAGESFQGFSALPSHLSVESDGKIYAAGNFNFYGGSKVNFFVRINPNGTIDNTFEYANSSSAAGFNTTVNTLLVSGSVIYFGGNFQAYKPTNSIIRLNTDGTWDNTFRIGESINPGLEITDVLVEPNDKIVFIGGFALYSGSTTNTTRIIRLNSDGTQDPTFVTGVGANNTPYSITRRPDGKFVMIGNFTQYSGSTSTYIVGINQSGSRDTTFNIGSGMSSVSFGTGIGKVISTPDNKIYVTAPLNTSYSGSTSGNIYRINPSGTLDTTFNPIYSNVFNRTGLGFAIDSGNPGGYSMILSGSSIIVVGQFTTYKSPVTQRGVMINSTGAISSSFNMGASGFTGTVRTWATQSDGKILAGGDFTQYSGSTSNRIVRINLNGTRDTSFNVGAGFNSTITDIRIQSDGKIIATGAFSTYSGSSQTGIIRLNTDGTRDTTFNVGTGASDSRHCKIQSDGKIVIVGNFATYSGSAQNYITRITPNGTRDTTFNIGTGLNQTPEAVIIQSDGKILTTGQFTSYSGSAQNRITRINPDGTRDTTFNIGTGLTGAGFALAQQSDGKIVCTSLTTTTYSGSTARFILRINTDGTLDTSFGFYPPVIGFGTTSNTQNSLAIANDGKIYWGNSFTTYSGSIPNGIVRLNTNGSVDETFNQAFPNFANNTGKGANSTINAVLLL